MNIQGKAQAAVDAVCPNFGISFGRLDDKTTWRIDFKPEATAEERAAAQAAIDAFDVEREVGRARDAGAAMARLRDIDAASVRALREWAAARADAPQSLKDREMEAAAQRAILREP